MKFLNLILTTVLLISSYGKGYTQSDTIRSFMFGHSLMDHRPPAIPTPSDETTIPHWIYLLAEESNKGYAATGQYGFLPQHANLPPFAQWGYDVVPAVWDSDTEPFSDANFNNVLITAGNFMQWQGPDVPIPGQGEMTVVSATEDIVDWLALQEDTMGIYIYENWPDMAGYLNNGFPATDVEFDNYNAYTLGDFHDWWLEYHDALLLSRPERGVRMIPVGPILAALYSDTILNNIPITELYEDDAPHGRATTYFLAGLITYTAIYQMEAPVSYTVPDIVHQTVRDNYIAVACYVHNYLLNFNDDNGVNRVFPPDVPLPVELVRFSAEAKVNNIELTWQTTSEFDNDKFEIEESRDGIRFSKIGEVAARTVAETPIDYEFVHQEPQRGLHYYRLKQIDVDGRFDYSEVVTATLEETSKATAVFYPNPSLTGQIQLAYHTQEEGLLSYSIHDINGTHLMSREHTVGNGTTVLDINLKPFGAGVFVIRMEKGGEVQYGRVMVY